MKSQGQRYMDTLTATLTVFLVAAIGGAAAKQHSSSRSQFQATCFPSCRCNRTVVECRDLGERTTELFRHIHPDVFPELDTLIVTGNSFGDLPNENIFGDNWRHTRLTLVNLSGNGIRSFGAQTFVGMPRVEYLYLDDNRLEEVEDDQPFNYFTSLKILSMRAVFGSHISVHARADLVRRVLHSNHSFVDLKEVILAQNRIDHLDEQTFCDVKGLIQLQLSGNELMAFDYRAGCLDELRMLDLSANRLAAMPDQLWKGLPSLNTLDVSRNPLVCDCQLQSFYKYAVAEENIFLNQGATTCASPPALAGKQLFALSDDVNLCRRGGGFGRWLLLLLAGVGLLLVYRYSRAHPVAAAVWRKCSDASRSMRTPLVADGYSQLKFGEDAFASHIGDARDVSLPPPAFV